MRIAVIRFNNNQALRMVSYGDTLEYGWMHSNRRSVGVVLAILVSCESNNMHEMVTMIQDCRIL